MRARARKFKVQAVRFSRNLQETTTDTAWFVLATDGEVGEDLAAQSWGYVDGANVAPMWGSVKHAILVALVQKTIWDREDVNSKLRRGL